MRLQGKTALVTGAASGLGEAIARRFASEGASVVIADIDEDGGRRVAAEIGGTSRFVRLDVTKPDDWADAMAQIPTVDILVNNAGITTLGSIEDITLEQFRREFETDTVSVFLGCQHAIKAMKARGGSIINMSSLAGVRAGADLAAYSSAKAAITMLTKSVALHCANAGYGIRCNSIHPGVIHTAILEKVLQQTPERDALYAHWVSVHPIGRIGKPEEVAALATYLATDESGFTTGAEFRVDGGASI